MTAHRWPAALVLSPWRQQPADSAHGCSYPCDSTRCDARTRRRSRRPPCRLGMSVAGHASASQAVDLAQPAVRRESVARGRIVLARAERLARRQVQLMDAARALGGGLDLARVLRGVGHGAPSLPLEPGCGRLRAITD